MFIRTLELLWWQQTATTTTHHLHLHLHTEHRLKTQLCLEFWYVNFFCPLLNNYLLLDCVWNCNQDDNGKQLPPLGQWMGTQDASSVSRVSGMFFFFLKNFLDMFLFSFFIIVSTYLDTSTTTTTILSNRTSRCNMSQAQVSFFFMFLFFLN